MKRRKRRMVVAVSAAIVVCAVLLIVIHLPSVQRGVWDRLAAALEEKSGLRIDVDELRVRYLPARVSATGLSISAENEVFLSLDRFEAKWRWLGLFSKPRRIDVLVVEGVSFDADALPQPQHGESQTAPFPWEALEVGEFRVRGISGEETLSGVEVAFDDVNIDGRFVSGSASFTLAAQKLLLTRSTRVLDLGRVSAAADVSNVGVRLERFELVSPSVSLTAAGELERTAETRGRFEIDAACDLSPVAGWWEPNLVSGLEPAGLLEVEGEITIDPDLGFEANLHHRGEPLRFAGYDIEKLGLEFHGGHASLLLAHPAWGRAEVTVSEGDVATVSASLDHAPIDRILSFAAPRAAEFIGRPATVSGEIDGQVSYPIQTDLLAGEMNLILNSPQGNATIRGRGSGTAWSVDGVEARAGGAVVTARGTIDAGASIDLEGTAATSDPAETAAFLSRWLPHIDDLAIAGGPAEVSLQVTGTIAEPNVRAEAQWFEPMIGGVRLESLAASAEGPLADFEWGIDLLAASSSRIVATGSVKPLHLEAQGAWEIRVEDLGELVPVLGLAPELAARGAVEAAGDLRFGESGIRVNGQFLANDLLIREWSVAEVRATFSASPDLVEISALSAAGLDGTLDGELTLDLTDGSERMAIDLRWGAVDLGELPIQLPVMMEGLVSGTLHLDGSPQRPEGNLQVSWSPKEAAPLIGKAELSADLGSGTINVGSGSVETAAGRLLFEAEIPLGDLPLPDWFWGDAPGGQARAAFRLPDVDSASLKKALGLEEILAEVEGDLRAEVSWNPLQPDRPTALLQADGLRVRHPTGDLVSEGPLLVSVDGRRLEVKPFVMVGLDSRLEFAAAYDQPTHAVSGHLRARLSPLVSGMLPLPITVDGPIEVEAGFEVPADRATQPSAVRALFTVDHREGRLVMRDPPLEILGLHLEAEFEDGVLYITDGTATVNRGHVEIGGGWDPESGQGVILELDDVATVMAGILTQWDGHLAIEPHPDRLAHVHGDLTLVVGIWEERFDLASAVLRGDSSLALDDRLHDITLDLVVRGLAGIEVENNLGVFDVNWEQLRVEGTVAEPVLRGELKIAPGGVLLLAGHQVKVRQGDVEFTGNPDIDPVMEIVPESDTMLVGGQDSPTASTLATRGLAQGISSALGFENLTLRPAEIATQTEKDPSERFMVGQRLSSQLALFLATNLSDVQDQMTMLQYWNNPRFKGLALQAYNESADENLGANLFQRFEWGGSKLGEELPEIHRIRLEGEWPLSKRRLRRATRLRSGQPYDEFLLFVGAVRMERLLAEHGYQEARVTSAQEGKPSSPVMVFSCNPGRRQPVSFLGDSLPAQLRQEVTALYRRPPLQRSSFEDMRTLIRDRMVADGYLAPEISVARSGEEVVVDLRKGERIVLSGPILDGVPPDAAATIEALLGSQSTLAKAIDRPEWAGEAVTRVLRRSGYIEATVVEVAGRPSDDGSLAVHIVVEPGSRALLASVELEGDDPLGLTEAEGFALQPGTPLDRQLIDSELRDLRHAYFDAGYADAATRMTIERDEIGAWGLRVRLDPGRRATVREVRFSGQRHVAESVLLKGVTVEPGDVLVDEELNRSTLQIAEFAPVERATATTKAAQHSQIDVEFDVVEKDRWTVEAGGGWSTERGFAAAFGVRDDSLFGRGVGLNVRGSLDAIEKRAFLIGSIPPVPGGRLSFISTVGYSTGDAPDDPDLLQDEWLASLEASYRLPKEFQIGLYYRWTETRTYDRVPDDFFPFDVNLQVATLGLRAVVDRFDFLFDPRRGWGLTADLGWSGGAIGSELEVVRWLSGFSLALEPFRGATWLQSVNLGIAEPLKGSSLDRDSKFFAGGQSSIRGFDLNSVGPVNENDGLPEGGGALFVLNEELRIPVWKSLRLAVFADVGQVWESWREADLDFSVGLGLGVRWSTPIGPLWADVAWPVANVGISSTKPKFYLGIGRPF